MGCNDHQLSTAAGQLCLRAQVWGQAKKNFEDAIRTAPTAINYAGLAQALRGMGDINAAQTAEQQATQLNQVKVLDTH